MDRRSFLLAAAAVPAASQVRSTSPGVFPDLMREPDVVTAHSESGPLPLKRAGSRWSAAGVEVATEVRKADDGPEAAISITAPGKPLARVHLRWTARVPETWRFLGDHWERSYGDLEWRGMVGDRLMPWYFLASDTRSMRGYGLRTGASSVGYWQVDAGGVSLWLDVRNGGSDVLLGDRRLEAAIVVGSADGARALCRRMCRHPRLPAEPVYGSNNWYYTYGENCSAEALLRDSQLMAELAPSSRNRPFMVMDMGWAAGPEGAGPVEKTAATFPDMAGLAAAIKKGGVRPGIWVRPLLTIDSSLPSEWRLPGDTVKAPLWIIDPTAPEALGYVEKQMRTVHEWGYELIKHDFSTFDLTGRWGFQMGPELTNPGWHFHDRSRTTAEIILDLYRALRRGAGNSLLLGCNTMGHLGAGLFEVQRIGDDTSGREWARTRKMGVNTLAFRMPQHNTFFAADADCVPVTKAIPWALTKEWLDLVARSGTPLFVSADPPATGPEQRAALRKAFAEASRPAPPAEPLDWMDTTAPRRWSFNGSVTGYRWYEE
jgi:alpha-galactosidase